NGELSTPGELELHPRIALRLDALLFLRHSQSTVHYAATQDRAVAGQWLANLRAVARGAGRRVHDQLASARMGIIDYRGLLWTGGAGRPRIVAQLFRQLRAVSLLQRTTRALGSDHAGGRCRLRATHHTVVVSLGSSRRRIADPPCGVDTTVVDHAARRFLL